MKKRFECFIIMVVFLLNTFNVNAAVLDGSNFLLGDKKVHTLINLDEKPIAPGMNIIKNFKIKNDTKYLYTIEAIKINNIKIEINNGLYNVDEIKESFKKALKFKLMSGSKTYFNETMKALENQRIFSEYVTLAKNEEQDFKLEVYFDESADNSLQNILCNFDIVLVCSYNDQKYTDHKKSRSRTSINKYKPVLTLIGTEEMTIYQGEKFEDPGAIAFDKEDGDITKKIVVSRENQNGKIDTNILGQYILHYDVKDSHGNKAETVTRILNVVEKAVPIIKLSKPVITLIGDEVIEIEKGLEYIDLGAVAYDEKDGDLTDEIVVRVKEGEVNTDIQGEYIITYNVVNSEGIAADEVIRKVVVIDTEIMKVSDQLPKTGESNHIIYYMLGGLCLIAGIVINKSVKRKGR